MAIDPRLLSIFISSPIFIVISIYILFAKILSKSKTYISRILGLFYSSAIVSVVLNIIYAILGIFNKGDLDLIILIIYYITITLMYGAGIYLTVATFLLYEKFNGKEKKLRIMELIYIFAFYVFTIPSYFIFNGVKIGDSTENKPVWDAPFTIYYYLIFIIMIVIPVYFFIIKIRGFFRKNDKRLMKKWDYFIIGITSLIIGITMNFLSYSFAEFRMFFNLINAIGLILGPILIGYSYSECKK